MKKSMITKYLGLNFEVKALIEQINSFFKSEHGNDINISSYYTNDFIFNSYPEGFRKGVQTYKLEYINN